MYQITLAVLSFGLLLQAARSARIVDTRTIAEKQGRDVVLTCRFEQLQTRDRVMWSKDDVVLSVNMEISGDKKKYEITGKYDLIIKSVVGQDSGRYLCQNFDQALSINVLLTVLTRPSQPDLQQTNRSLVENQVGRFLCLSKGGNPLPTFTWVLNQVKLNESFYHVYPNTRQSYSQLYLPLEKRFHDGLLTCQVQNQALDKPLQSSYTLNIQYKPSVSLRYNQAVVSNLNVLIAENEQLTIDCLIDSNPTLNRPITWSKDGVVISGNTASSLTLPAVRRTDDGEYSCSSTNIIGQGHSSVHIRVQYAPLVELTGGGLIDEDDRLVLICNVNAYPLIDYYQWYKNNEKLNTSSLTSSIIVEKVSKANAGNYQCVVKNTLKYTNGSAVEKFNKSQARVIVQYAPKVYTDHSIVAADLHATDVRLHCQLDSYPEATVTWRFHDRLLLNSTRYSFVQNESSSFLILRQVQSDRDYGLYSCNATNKLGYNSTSIQLRSKDVPDPPMNLNVTSVGYSTIAVSWKPGFDGGWSQSFWISLDNTVWKETSNTFYTFTNLRHLEYHNITVRAHNQLGQSSNSGFIRVQTKDVPVEKEGLPLLEHTSLHPTDKSIHYRINDSSFAAIKVPLCIRIEISNHTHTCQRLVTSSGVITVDDSFLHQAINASICLDQYESFCGGSQPIATKRETSANWLFIIISSIVTVTLLILLGLCIFYFILKRRRQRRRNPTHNLITISSKKSLPHPAAIEPIATSPTKFFSNVTYPEQQQIPPSYLSLEKYPGTAPPSIGKLSNDANEFTLPSPKSIILCTNDQLTVSDFHPLDATLTPNPASTCPPGNAPYGFPFYEINGKERNAVVADADDDDVEGVYSTPVKNDLLNKKTVYEVVV